MIPRRLLNPELGGSDIYFLLILLISFILKGKTRYYFDTYSQTHEWVPTRRLIEVEKLSFHRIIQRVIKVLKSGRSVCVDDTNHAERTRASYLQVRFTFPPCFLLYIKF